MSVCLNNKSRILLNRIFADSFELRQQCEFFDRRTLVSAATYNNSLFVVLSYERVGILAVSEINEAIDRQVVSQTLSALQSSAASLSHVFSDNADHYQQLLATVKSEKAQVEISLCVSAVSNRM